MSEGGPDDELDAALMRERHRFARDVHDALGGDLVAIKMALAVLERRLPPDPALRDQCAYVDKLVDDAIDSMHQVIEQSRQVPGSTLDEVVVRLLADFSRQSGVVCRQELVHVSIDMATPAAQALHYILRECLSNIGKHAQAQQIRVALRTANNVLVLEVEDNGVGAGEHDRLGKGSGLIGMRERAEEQGGEFSMRGIAPHGTLIRVEIPLGNTQA